jgi:hypothetical protein
MADKTATFNVKVEASTESVLAGKYNLEKFRDAVASSQGIIKQYQSNLKALRGSSDEVKKAKIDLKARIDAERDAISRATLKIQEHGSTLKGAAKETSVMAEAVEGITLKSVAATVGITALVAAVTAAIVAFPLLALNAAAANRALMTNLEGTTGSAKNAQAFGWQIDALAQKLPIARDKLYEMGSAMAEAWGQSRITGQGIQDSFDAVSTVTAGMSEKAGSALQSIIDRGKQFGRIGLGYQELRPLGLKIEDVYARIAKNAGRSFDDVRLLSMQGVLDVNAFATAVKQVAHERFDPVIGKKMLDLDVIVTRFKQNLTGLFKNAHIDPLLGSLSKLVALFDENTVTGHELQAAISSIADVMNTLITAVLPSAQGGLKHLAATVLNVGADVLDGITWMILSWNKLKAFDWKAVAAGLTVVMIPAFISIGTAAGTAAVGVGALALSFAPFIAAGAAVGLLVDQIIKLKRETAGMSVGDILKGGIGPSSGAGVTSWGAGALPVTAPGHAEGGMVAKPAPGEFFASVAPGEHIVPDGAGLSGGSGGGSGAAPLEINFHIAGGAAKEAVAALQTGSVLSLITHAIETGLRSAGYPTQQAPAT